MQSRSIVLDEGGSGILGLGSRQARVRISILGEGEESGPGRGSRANSKEPNADQTLNLVEEIVSELLEKMNMEATVEAKYGEESDKLPHAPILVDITGNDLSVLIGRRAKTLNALQYITRLILGKELEHGIPLSIDVEGYRERQRTAGSPIGPSGCRSGSRYQTGTSPGTHAAQ